MSGFELAGVVLGAFPIAISTLNAGFEKYGAVARKLKLFYAFKSEHKKYRDELKFNQLMFNANLRRLLLPLVVSDDKIEVLLADPGGPEWSQHEFDNHLRRRLKHSYTLFLDYMVNIKEIINDLNRQLTIVGEAAKDKANHTTLSLKERFLATLSKENREFLLYKAGFTNAEPARKRLLDDMRDCIEKLERLLSSNDEEARLTEQRKTSDQKLSDTAAICNFWKHAVRLLRALASSSCCNCRATHSAELLLQHRIGGGTDFWIDFITSDYSKWEIFKTKITESNEIIVTQLQDTVKFLEKTSVRQPNHRQLNPMRSALKSSTLSTTTQVIRKTSSIMLVPEQPNASFGITQEISTLCVALSSEEGSCCGFLRDDFQRFYISKLSHYVASTSPSTITLDQILTGDIQLRPTRKQRYGLALTLASSFLQLHDSMWLPTPFTKYNVFFKSDANGSGDLTLFPLTKPYVQKRLENKGKATEPNIILSQVNNDLDQLGILLLELCFGKTLKSHPCRKEWPEGGNAKEIAAFDLLAARSWQRQVLEEAGSDFAEAVGWCLGGNRTTTTERWRQEMFLKVIERLQRCQDYLDTIA